MVPIAIGTWGSLEKTALANKLGMESGNSFLKKT